MAFNLTPNVSVRRDDEGHVRQLSHPQQPYRPDSVPAIAVESRPATVTPRALAESYLREVAPIYGFPQQALSNFAATEGASPTEASTELRFKEEKNIANNATVSYNQTHFGLPIWDAGVSVRISLMPMQVTGSHNATHYDIHVDPIDPNALYMPHSLAPSQLKKLLGLTLNDDDPVVNATRLLVYYYLPDQRLDPQGKAHANPTPSTGLGGDASPEFPSLPLPPIPDQITPGKHYVVTEALFTLSRPQWGSLNWRAFIEPKSGAVLYLRPLVSCARGAVFATDPISATGTQHTAATAANVLDSLRSTVNMLGLHTPASVATPQELTGEFVRLTEVDPPSHNFPVENAPFDFIYSCPTTDFAACCGYYHCDGVFRMIQGMGIDVTSYFNNTDFPVPVDTHALQGQVNAQARGNKTGNGMGAFVFGVAQAGNSMGIVADVRVILHEFGHALLWDHVSSPNFGFAHSAGDSLATILHDPGSRAPDRFETFPFMKASSGLSRRHDRDIRDGWAWFGPKHRDQFDGTQYLGEQILSTTLFRIYRATGGDSSNLEVQRFASRYMVYLIIKGCGLLSFMTPDPVVFVSALIDADSGTVNFEGLPGGTLAKVIRWSFEKQGLFQPPGAPALVMAEGEPPDTDVYIDDGRHGEYMPYSDNHEGHPDIWNRNAADGGTVDQPPVIGASNFAYTRVRNRGTLAAAAVVVRAFQTKAPGGKTWPTDWKAATTVQLALAAPLPPGQDIVVGPFEWIPQRDGESLLMSVSANGDLSHVDTVTSGPLPIAKLVLTDNNIAHRRFGEVVA
jgi:hypothetical protein